MAEETVEDRLEWLEKREWLFSERIAQIINEIDELKRGFREVGSFVVSHIHPGHAQTLPWAPPDTQPTNQVAEREEG